MVALTVVRPADVAAMLAGGAAGRRAFADHLVAQGSAHLTVG
jgi:hypothetical protein